VRAHELQAMYSCRHESYFEDTCRREARLEGAAVRY